MDKESVIKKLREMKVQFATEKIGVDPARLPQFLAEFLGYQSILAEHYYQLIIQYGIAKARVLEEEYSRKDEINKVAEKREDRVTVTEVQSRIDRRLGEVIKERDAMDVLWKTNTQFINVCQSLIRAWGDEAKGIM